MAFGTLEGVHIINLGNQFGARSRAHTVPLIVLGHDFWAWGQTPPRLWAGLPLWIWYFFALGLLMCGVFARALRRSGWAAGVPGENQGANLIQIELFNMD